MPWNIQLHFRISAAQGWTSLVHVLVGSVVEKLVRHSTVPVLTVRLEQMHGSVLEEEELEEQLRLKI
ncbi:MAG: universal stress protein [Bacteroidota bacterium]